jgi:predicted ATPase
MVTHSPILLGIPGAEILSFDEGQIHPIEYEDTDSYQITKLFVENREQLLNRLLSE